METDNEILKLAEKFKKFKIEAIGVFFLESIYPLRTIMLSATEGIEPIFKTFNIQDKLKFFKEIFSSEETYKEFIRRLERD